MILKIVLICVLCQSSQYFLKYSVFQGKVIVCIYLLNPQKTWPHLLDRIPVVVPSEWRNNWLKTLPLTNNFWGPDPEFKLHS